MINNDKLIQTRQIQRERYLDDSLLVVIDKCMA